MVALFLWSLGRWIEPWIKLYRSSGNIMHSGMCLTFKVEFVVASLSISSRGQKLKRQGWKKCLFHKVSQPLKTPHIYLLSSPSSFSLCFCHSMLYFCTRMRMSLWFLPGPLEIYLADYGCRFPHNAQVSTCLSRLISLQPCICWFGFTALSNSLTLVFLCEIEFKWPFRC